MNTFLTILIVIVALVLILIVVIQNSKGGGLAAGFASTNQVMGVRKTTDFLEKATWYLAAGMVVLCILATISLRSGKGGDGMEINTEGLRQTTEQTEVAPFQSSEVEETEQQPQE